VDLALAALFLSSSLATFLCSSATVRAALVRSAAGLALAPLRLVATILSLATFSAILASTTFHVCHFYILILDYFLLASVG
jgi:hypothetical protein